jgi:FkbM family methyltransferase
MQGSLEAAMIAFLVGGTPSFPADSGQPFPNNTLRAVPCHLPPANASCKMTHQNFVYCAPEGNIEATIVRRKRVWEPDNTYALEKEFKAHPSALVLDIGARAGWFTMLALTRGLRVIAVEANQRSVCFLQHNVKVNQLSDASLFLINRPVSDVVGQPVHMHGIHVDTNLNYSSAPPLMTMTLDAIIPLMPAAQKVILQMDIEGYECKALLGATRLLHLAKIVGVIHEYSVIEANHLEGCSWAPVFHILQSELGLKPHRIVPHGRGVVVPLEGSHETWKRQGLALHSNLLWRFPKVVAELRNRTSA